MSVGNLVVGDKLVEGAVDGSGVVGLYVVEYIVGPLVDGSIVGTLDGLPVGDAVGLLDEGDTGG